MERRLAARPRVRRGAPRRPASATGSATATSSTSARASSAGATQPGSCPRRCGGAWRAWC